MGRSVLRGASSSVGAEVTGALWMPFWVSGEAESVHGDEPREQEVSEGYAESRGRSPEAGAQVCNPQQIRTHSAGPSAELGY